MKPLQELKGHPFITWGLRLAGEGRSSAFVISLTGSTGHSLQEVLIEVGAARVPQDSPSLRVCNSPNCMVLKQGPYSQLTEPEF